MVVKNEGEGRAGPALGEGADEFRVNRSLPNKLFLSGGRTHTHIYLIGVPSSPLSQHRHGNPTSCKRFVNHGIEVDAYL